MPQQTEKNTTLHDPSAIREALRAAMITRIRSGIFPFDGQWVTGPALEQQLRNQQKNLRTQTLELATLYTVMLLASGFLILLLWILCY